MEIPYLLGIFTGMRRGEILALKWSDVDLAFGKIHIRRSLARTKNGLIFTDIASKTSKSKRQISISSYVCEKLKKHKSKQLHQKEKLL